MQVINIFIILIDRRTGRKRFSLVIFIFWIPKCAGEDSACNDAIITHKDPPGLHRGYTFPAEVVRPLRMKEQSHSTAEFLPNKTAIKHNLSNTFFFWLLIMNLLLCKTIAAHTEKDNAEQNTQKLFLRAWMGDTSTSQKGISKLSSLRQPLQSRLADR